MSNNPITKLLIANRGEVAERIIRTCREMGIATVAVFSDADRNARYVRKADETIHLGPSAPAESYLNIEKIIHAAKYSNVDAIHPGYGFLAENAAFAAKCRDERIIFVGPSPEVIESMGSKTTAKELVQKLGIPVIEGYNGKDQNIKTLISEAKKIGFPVLLKAVMGGGGKGMRIINNEGELTAGIESAKREAEKSFGDGMLIIEKYLDSIRHIEIQIIGDDHGNYLHCFERECSIQRRYQKIIEESPSPVMPPQLRDEMTSSAIEIAKALKYSSTGTVEFIVDKSLNYYFLEVNTRLQVEHPVTEMITDLDLVKTQIEIAEGKELSFKQEDIKVNGHAIESRIYAEDPGNNFLPCTGKILAWREKELPGVRYDSGVETGSNVDVFYDPMLAKVIAHGSSRQECLKKLNHALKNLAILGITCNKEFLTDVLNNPDCIAGNFDTNFISKHFPDYKKTAKLKDVYGFAIAALIWEWKISDAQRTVLKHMPSGWRNNFYQPQTKTYLFDAVQIKLEYRNHGENKFTVQINTDEGRLPAESRYNLEQARGTGDDKKYKVEFISLCDNQLSCLVNGNLKSFVIAEKEGSIYVHSNEQGCREFTKESKLIPSTRDEIVNGTYTAPMPGEVVKILAKTGKRVKAGEQLLIINSMKMENAIEAQADGVVDEIFVEEKAFVEADTLLLTVKKNLT